MPQVIVCALLCIFTNNIHVNVKNSSADGTYPIYKTMYNPLSNMFDNPCLKQTGDSYNQAILVGRRPISIVGTGLKHSQAVLYISRHIEYGVIVV